MEPSLKLITETINKQHLYLHFILELPRRMYATTLILHSSHLPSEEQLESTVKGTTPR